ncbi:MAG: ATP-dependent helicase/nuclease subunit B, partial [Rickettsiales bacterium]
VDGKMELLEFFNEILNSKINFSLEPESYNQLLQNFLKDYSFRKSGDFHPRLHILSTMEARLLTQDLTIVSGLLEGSFPSQTSGDWLGNKIRSEVGMTSHARRIGVEAYDFCNYLQGREVVLTHPLSQNNSPTLKSRFLLKLETVLKINGLQEFLNDGKEYLHLLELKNDSAKTESRTNPKPAQKLPRLSATDISKWIRNPYYIYAKRILNLKPLKQIEQEASFAEFGNFVHKALEEFVENYPQIDLLDYGKKIFNDYFPDKTSHLLWFAKFENIAKWFVAYEETLRENLQESFVEVEVEALIGDILTTTKIDRVNLYQDGSMEIIDYKTGAVPSMKDVKSGLEPQLPVEGLILMCGKIKNYPHLAEKIGAGGIGNLQYQNVKGNDQSKITNFADAGDLIFAADEGVKRLIAMFENEDFGYICAPNLDLYKQDDYWHLGRIGEL